MRRLPAKARVTLWYAALLVAICALAFAALSVAAERTSRAYHREKLEDAAARIVRELSEALKEGGALEIGRAAGDIPNVYASLFEADGRLIYGRARVNLPFEEGALRRVEDAPHGWYVLDTRLNAEGRADVWLRTYASVDASLSAAQAVSRCVLWLLPLLAAVALAGGYFITARAFLPVKDMARLAGSIAGGGDLSRRIEAAQPRDELGALAGVFNAMLGRLERAFARERRFTSDVAHELRTPLSAVVTQCEYALSRTDPAEKDEALRRILHKSGEMNALAGQLLTLARVEAGQMAREDDCALDEMLGEIAQDMEPLAQARGMRMETALIPHAMRANRALLARAFINLIDNAVRYGREGGVVRIAMREEDGHICVRVEDDGCGIAADDLPMVFERFWRADGARSAPGTGVGLSIAKGVVQAHGGEIGVRSKPGQGTAFDVRFAKGGAPAGKKRGEKKL